MNNRDKDWPPFQTTVLITLLLLIFWWFLKGQSFRLYASLFFVLYDLTSTVWISIILVSVVQNLVLMPLSLLSEKLYPEVKEFEAELESMKTDEQSLVFKKKVKEGNWAVLVYIINFVILAIAFISAGRVFLLDFYYEKINSWYLWKFVPYPTYPLEGTTFYFPWVEVTKTMAIAWKNIFLSWVIVLGFFAVMRAVWLFLRNFLSGNKSILGMRIKYNRVLFWIGGVAGTFFIASAYVLRNLPTGINLIMLEADLTKQNTTLNIITAVATFFAATYSGVRHNSEGREMALASGLPTEPVERVFKERNKRTLRNATLVASLAYLITHQMPSSHDISVLAFEVIYILIAPKINKAILKRIKSKPEVVEA